MHGHAVGQQHRIGRRRRQYLAHGLRHCRRIPDGHGPAKCAIDSQILHGVRATRDDGLPARGQRLDHHRRIALVLRGQHEGARLVQPRLDAAGVARQRHAPGEPQRRDLLAQALLIRPLAHDGQAHRGVVDQRNRLDQRAETLLADQAARRHEMAAALRHGCRRRHVIVQRGRGNADRGVATQYPVGLVARALGHADHAIGAAQAVTHAQFEQGLPQGSALRLVERGADLRHDHRPDWRGQPRQRRHHWPVEIPRHEAHIHRMLAEVAGRGFTQPFAGTGAALDLHRRFHQIDPGTQQLSQLALARTAEHRDAGTCPRPAPRQPQGDALRTAQRKVVQDQPQDQRPRARHVAH